MTADAPIYIECADPEVLVDHERSVIATLEPHDHTQRTGIQYWHRPAQVWKDRRGTSDLVPVVAGYAHAISIGDRFRLTLPADEVGRLLADWRDRLGAALTVNEYPASGNAYEIARDIADGYRFAIGPRPGPAGDTKDRGLYDKYQVDRTDGQPLKGGRCIVLEVGDPNAHAALATWSQTVRAAGYEALADDVDAMLAEQGHIAPPIPEGARWLAPGQRVEVMDRATPLTGTVKSIEVSVRVRMDGDLAGEIVPWPPRRLRLIEEG